MRVATSPPRTMIFRLARLSATSFPLTSSRPAHLPPCSIARAPSTVYRSRASLQAISQPSSHPEIPAEHQPIVALNPGARPIPLVGIGLRVVSECKSLVAHP